MAYYRNISLSFWTDAKVEDTFTPEDKYMYLYLLTNPYTNICGCYEISIKQISRQTGYNEEAVARILQRMEQVHKVIVYSKDTQEVLIMNWGRYNWTKSEKLVKPIMSAIGKIKHGQFRDYVTLVYENIEIIDAVSIPYQYGIDTTVSVTDTVTVSVTDARATPKPPKGDDVRFDEFWAAYPNKKAKEPARKAFNKLKLQDGEFADILSALSAHKQSIQWTKDNGQFIPLPATWLNQRRWEDELKPELSNEEVSVNWA